MKLKTLATALLATMALGFSTLANAAEDYNFDIKGQHAFIQFKVKHLGFSYELGSFQKFDGSFHYDEQQPENNTVNVTIDTASLDTNHAERNKHLRSDDFFDVEKYPTATFTSTSYKDLGDGKAVLTGDFTLHGVTKSISLDLNQIGAGNDPWGGFRRGFEATTTLHLSDYNMKKSAMLGPVSENIDIYLSIEGLRSKP